MPERVDRLRAAGVEGLEFGSIGRWDGAAESTLRASAPHVLLHNYFPPPQQGFDLNLASADPDIRSRSTALVERALALSEELGAPFYAVHAGFAADPIGFEGTSYTFPEVVRAAVEPAYDRFVRAIGHLAGFARERGVALLVENNSCPLRWKGVPFMCTPEDAARLFQDVGDDVGLLLDVGHLLVSARTYGFDPARFVQVHRDRIRALHLHENDGTRDTHDPMQRGGLALRLARQCGSAEWITVEAKCATLECVTEQMEAARTGLAGAST